MSTEYTRSYVLYYTIYLIKGYVGGGRSRVSGVSSIVHGSDRRTDGRTDGRTDADRRVGRTCKMLIELALFDK